MKQSLAHGLLILCFSLGACQNSPPANKESKQDDFAALSKDFMSWWAYHNQEINLSGPYATFDENGNSIGKGQFLEILIKQEFIIKNLNKEGDLPNYQLVRMDSLASEDVIRTLQNEARKVLHHYNMEGKALPDYTWEALEGDIYNKESTLGKTLIIKTWFIGCKACVAEFPELNSWYENHQEDDKLLFISLATDPKENLERFLEKTPFKYEVIPEQGNYISQDLKLRIYPTHLIVDEEGKVIKVFNKASELIEYFEDWYPSI